MKPGATLALLLLASVSTGQIAYPDLVIQDVDWSSGVHEYAFTQGVLAPAVPELPVNVEETAEVEFVSARHVHLTPGFHAGDFVNEGFFHARIDEAAGPAGDIVVVTPDPVEHLIDHVLHVPKWEKLEVGLQLPQEYMDAIDRFFANYYSNGTAQAATPTAVNDTYDLNPYADDSLQLVMQLTDPDGQQRMKWGFFMREAKWDETASDPDEAILVEHSSSPFHPYHVRFRFAPDKEGPWQFTLSLKAPYTTTLANEPLPHLVYTGNTFVCDPPLEDNKGYLQVNEANRRILQFENGDPFFGLGTNMADARNNYWTDGPSDRGISMHQRDFNSMQETMALLHDVGGNYVRMYLMRNIFAPEWVNLGVYDNFKAPVLCPIMPEYANNSQFNCWAFDRMLDQARANNIYIQLCIDPYPPIVAYQSYIWGAHPYVLNYLENDRDANGRYDLKKFFYTDGDPENTGTGAFYYWKRKYKYMMARWGYSVNVAALEPFNEIDQMLTYQDADLSVGQHYSTCPANRLNWPRDPDLPGILNSWISDIADHVRGPVVLSDPVNSPLGEDRKLFLMSYTNNELPNTTQTDHYLPFTNPKVDLVDVHRGMLWGDQEVNNSFQESQDFRNTYVSNGSKKPFIRGEYNYYALIDHDNNPNTGYYETSHVFGNYDVSFHNELWASAFTGNFAAGMTWHWERVFWWEDALPKGPPAIPLDSTNFFGQVHSGILDDTNILDIGTSGTPIPVQVKNQRVHHHFKPLSDFLSNPNLQALGLFESDFSAHKVFDVASGIECYYVMNGAQDVAIGWVHNLKAYWENNYYLTNTMQHFLDCESPDGQVIEIPGLQTGLDYFISYFPTRMNTTICPMDDEDLTQSGTVTLDLSSAPLNGIVANHLDTLHSDYAFIVASTLVKNLPVPAEHESIEAETDWDFTMYSNPARDELFLRLQDDMPKDITISDLSGRQVLGWSSLSGSILRLPIAELAMGVYNLRVLNGASSRAKKLVIY